MINETASSPEDRPALRTSTRLLNGEENAEHMELRQLISSVFVIENESFDADMSVLSRDGVLLINPESQLVASFSGQLLTDSEEAYAYLDDDLQERDLLPVFRQHEGKHVIHILTGRVNPRPRAVWVNAVLFIVTLLSVLLLGAQMGISEIARTNEALAQQLAGNLLLNLWRGLPYAVSIMLILGAHELGHYFAARYHKISVTLPYFIPAPLIGFLGTFGAFIQLREPMRNRKVLLDIGAAGPLMGLVFAIPILFIGLATAHVGPITAGGLLEGNSLLYAGAKTLVFGRFLPDGSVDVYLNQLAMAGWAGLLVTALNLIPIGQLDGGHILYSLIGDRARRLYYPLIGISVALAIQTQAWILWVVLLLLFGRTYAAPLDMITPLDRRRLFIALLSLFIFVVIFVPVPLTVIEGTGGPGPSTPPSQSIFNPVWLTAVVVLVWQRLRR